MIQLLSPHPRVVERARTEPDFKVYAAMCVHRDVKVSVFRNMRTLEKCPNPQFEFKIIEGDALISRSRSRVATKFLEETDFKYLLFLDDDIIYDPLDLRKLMLEMEKEEIYILGAGYVTKSEEKPNFTIRTLERNEDMRFGKDGGIFEVRMIATGCMAVHRRVLQTMVDKEIVHLCHKETNKFYPFFNPAERQIDGKWLYMSEDWEFCERARELGFKIYVDTSIKLGHIGQKTFDWDDLLNPPKIVRDGINWQVRITKE